MVSRLQRSLIIACNVAFDLKTLVRADKGFLLSKSRSWSRSRNPSEPWHCQNPIQSGAVSIAGNVCLQIVSAERFPKWSIGDCAKSRSARETCRAQPACMLAVPRQPIQVQSSEIMERTEKTESSAQLITITNVEIPSSRVVPCLSVKWPCPSRYLWALSA